MSDSSARPVILAAGTSSRVGKQKLLLEFRGRPLIEFAIAAARRAKPVVVCGAEVAAYLANRTDLALVRNDEPQRGMSHSLALANRAIPDDTPIVVLLGDKPLVTEALIESLCRAAQGADLVYPVRDGEPGHPVLLSPRARKRIAALPAGDTLRLLRDDAQLVTRAVAVDDSGAFFDVDTPDCFPGRRGP